MSASIPDWFLTLRAEKPGSEITICIKRLFWFVPDPKNPEKTIAETRSNGRLGEVKFVKYNSKAPFLKNAGSYIGLIHGVWYIDSAEIENWGR